MSDLSGLVFSLQTPQPRGRKAPFSELAIFSLVLSVTVRLPDRSGQSPSTVTNPSKPHHLGETAMQPGQPVLTTGTFWPAHLLLLSTDPFPSATPEHGTEDDRSARGVEPVLPSLHTSGAGDALRMPAWGCQGLGTSCPLPPAAHAPSEVV